jgi:pyrroline-5-carboxylate reductase
MLGRTIGFIGTGNMGSAMIRGIINSKLVTPGQISAFDVNSSKLNALRDETEILLCQNNEEVINNTDIIIIAVKPDLVASVLHDIKHSFGSDKIIVSFAVGVPIRKFKEILGEEAKIIRTMPNTPMMVNEGMTLISHSHNVTSEEIEIVKKLFECCGKAEILPEKLMTEVTALTGSSPAYVYIFIEAMADAAVLSGIPRDLAYKLASQAVLGSAKMVLESGKHPGELKDMVCSPAGTTIEAVAVLEKSGFRSSVIEAMNACTQRARLIGDQQGNGRQNEKS